MTSTEKLYSKVAIVADQMTSFGGADRELYSMLKLFPKADIFTIAFNKSCYPSLKNKVYTSNLQKLFKVLPFKFAKHLKIFTPWVYENFDLNGYDLILSISAGPAKGIITTIDQPHIAMTMTPPRSLWDKEHNFRASKLKKLYSFVSSTFDMFMRIWDISIAKRVDYWTANSVYIQKKIKRIYGKEATVLYPGIEERYFKNISSEEIKNIKEKYSLPEKFVLVVSRLYDYKQIDWAIRACKTSKKDLIIVGDGPDKPYLQKLAKGNSQIKFLGYIPDNEVIVLYHLAEVLLFCGIEDFGLVPIEAMAAGTPVLSLKAGGTLETIEEHTSGEFFSNESELLELLKDFDKRRYNKEEITKQARRFTEKEFLHNLEKYIEEVHEKETQK